jgi:hypothetical protein
MPEQHPELLTEILPSHPLPIPQPELLTEVLSTSPHKRKYCTPMIINDDTESCESCNV